MATSAYVSTEETTNACRACQLLLGPCTDELRDVLRHHVPPSRFPHVIVQNRSKLPRLTALQMNLILPRGSSYTGNYDDMDISLLYMLLRNICGITPHSNGWGNDPDPTDRSLSANIERIRKARNQCVFSSSPALSNADFNTVWSTLRSAVVDFDSFLNNGNQYEGEVDFLRHETMDPVRDSHYIEELRRQAEEDIATREIVHSLKRKYEESETDRIENQNKMQKIIDEMKMPKSAIPLNVKDIQEQDFMQWKEEDRIYSETCKFHAMLDKVRKHPYMTFVGGPGSGKSATIHHIALILQQEGYEVVPIKDIRKIEVYCDSRIPQVFVIDDVVGVLGLQQHLLNLLVDCEQIISNPINKNTKVLMSCREAVFNECYKSFLLNEKNVIKMGSSEYALTDDDKKEILQKHGLDRDLLSTTLLRETSDMFPLLCKLYSKEEKFRNNAERFFTCPEDILESGADVKHQGKLEEMETENKNKVPIAKSGTVVNPQVEGDSKLMAACQAGNLSVVKELIEAGADVNQEGWHNTPLTAACQGGHMSVVKELLQAGADFNALSESGRPLTAACQAGNLSVVKELLEAGAGADVNVLGESESPLTAACKAGNLSIVKELLEAGADVNLQSTFETPLTAACRGGHLGVVMVLLEAGADINLKVGDDTPMEAALKGEHMSVVRILLEAGADVNNEDIVSYFPKTSQYLDCFDNPAVKNQSQNACIFKKLEYLDCFGLSNKQCSRVMKHENVDIKISDLSVEDIQHVYKRDTNCDRYRMQAGIYFEIARNPAMGSLEHLLEPAVMNQDHILLHILTYRGTLLSEIGTYIQRLSQQAQQRYISETIASAIKQRLLEKYKIKRKSICDVRLCLNTDDKDTLVVCVLYRAYFAGDERFSGLPVIWKSFKQVNEESYLVLQEERTLCSNTDESREFSRSLPSISSSAAQKLFNSHCNLTMIMASRLKSRGFKKNEHTVEQKVTITLFCRHKTFRPLGESLFPKTIGNFDVDVLEGYCTFGSRNIEIGDEIQCERADQAGIRINKCGSVGGFVKFQNKLGVLTCAHVLYSLNDLKQAADSDEALPTGVPASVKTALWKCNGTVAKAHFAPNRIRESVDVALIAFDSSYTTNNTFAESKVNVRQLSFAGFDPKSPPIFTGQYYEADVPSEDRGHRVIKTGMATGLTCGSFYLNGSHVRMEFEDMKVCEILSSGQVQESFRMYDQIAVLSYENHAFFEIGDSGSFVFVLHPDKGLICVGMAIGKTTNNLCLVTPIKYILESLELQELYCPGEQPMDFGSGTFYNQASDQDNIMPMLKTMSSDIQSMKTDIQSMKSDIQELKNANAQGRNTDTGS